MFDLEMVKSNLEQNIILVFVLVEGFALGSTLYCLFIFIQNFTDKNNRNEEIYPNSNNIECALNVIY
jgi:hypothetical protein